MRITRWQVNRHAVRAFAQDQIAQVNIGKRFAPDFACLPRGIVPFHPRPMHFDDIRFGKRFQGRFYSCRKQNIVGIEEEDYIPATRGESGVQGRVLAAILL